jgi:hypothetical protein
MHPGNGIFQPASIFPMMSAVLFPFIKAAQGFRTIQTAFLQLYFIVPQSTPFYHKLLHPFTGSQ